MRRLPKLPVQVYSYDDLRLVAAEFLARHHPDATIPTPIEELVDLRLKIDIVPVARLEWEDHTAAYLSADLKEIRVDKHAMESNSNRYRFSLAHELSHLLLHRDIYQKLRPVTAADWKSKLRAISEEDYGWIEWQAYSLAGLILVPPGHLQVEFASVTSTVRSVGLSTDTDAVRLAVEKKLGTRFWVSGDVVSRRLRYDSLWQ